jgi:hypothetical protein
MGLLLATTFQEPTNSVFACCVHLSMVNTPTRSVPVMDDQILLILDLPNHLQNGKYNSSHMVQLIHKVEMKYDIFLFSSSHMASQSIGNSHSHYHPVTIWLFLMSHLQHCKKSSILHDKGGMHSQLFHYIHRLHSRTKPSISSWPASRLNTGTSYLSQNFSSMRLYFM